MKIRKDGEKIIIEPITKSQWPDGFWDGFKPDPGFKTPKPMPSKEQKRCQISIIDFMAGIFSDQLIIYRFGF